jgi:hypothetical protein
MKTKKISARQQKAIDAVERSLKAINRPRYIARDEESVRKQIELNDRIRARSYAHASRHFVFY